MKKTVTYFAIHERYSFNVFSYLQGLSLVVYLDGLTNFHYLNHAHRQFSDNVIMHYTWLYFLLVIYVHVTHDIFDNMAVCIDEHPKWILIIMLHSFTNTSIIIIWHISILALANPIVYSVPSFPIHLLLYSIIFIYPTC